MSTVFETDLKQYYEAVFSAVVCSEREKKQFMEDFPHSVEDFCEIENVKNIDAVIAHFGSAEQIAQSFLEEAEVAFA